MAEQELTTEEQSLVRGLLDPEATLEIAVPDTVNADDFWNSLGVCCKAMKVMRRMTERLRPVIGRMLLVAQKNPDIYTGKGYATFESFITDGVCEHLGLSRSDAYEAKRIAEHWPGLTPEEYAEVGSVKMTMITRVTNGTSKLGRKLIEQAKGLSVKDFRRILETRGLVSRGEFQGAVIVINTNQEIARHWTEFAGTAEIQAYCGTADHGLILKHMMEECSSWLAEGGREANIPWREDQPEDFVMPPPLRKG